MPCLAGVGSEAVSFSSILDRSSVGDLAGIGDLVGFGGMACVAFVGGLFVGALLSSHAVALAAAFADSTAAVAA